MLIPTWHTSLFILILTYFYVYLKCVSCVKLVVGLCFSIQPDKFCLLIRIFHALTFNIISGTFGFVCHLFHLFSVVIYVSLSLSLSVCVSLFPSFFQFLFIYLSLFCLLLRWLKIFLVFCFDSYWRKKWQPTPVFLPGESHGRRSLVGYSPWGRKESDMTERLHFTWFFYWLCKIYLLLSGINNTVPYFLISENNWLLSIYGTSLLWVTAAWLEKFKFFIWHEKMNFIQINLSATYIMIWVIKTNESPTRIPVK